MQEGEPKVGAYVSAGQGWHESMEVVSDDVVPGGQGRQSLVMFDRKVPVWPHTQQKYLSESERVCGTKQGQRSTARYQMGSRDTRQVHRLQQHQW